MVNLIPEVTNFPIFTHLVLCTDSDQIRQSLKLEGPRNALPDMADVTAICGGSQGMSVECL
jgi:hypothetical protein